MFSDPLLQDRYLRHIERLIELAEKEVARTCWLPEFHELARMYLEMFTPYSRWYFLEKRWEKPDHSFPETARGRLSEIITCGATHGYLPLMASPGRVRAQVHYATEYHTRLFGRPPQGIWLPECGYNPGDDEDPPRLWAVWFFFTDAQRRPVHASAPGQYGQCFCPGFISSLRVAPSCWGPGIVKTGLERPGEVVSGGAPLHGRFTGTSGLT